MHAILLSVITVTNYYSPDSGIHNVKCERDVMDEIIPDGLGSDSEDGEIQHACMYISVQIFKDIESEGDLQAIADAKRQFVLKPDFFQATKDFIIYSFFIIYVAI